MGNRVLCPIQKPGSRWGLSCPLQEGREILVPYLVRFFRACLATGYVLTAWCQVKVVFIPKPGKDTYGGPKGYRPISLTSFLLKTMERLVDRFIRDEMVISCLLHPNQHAYQAGKSTEMALHQLVRIEKAFDQKETALGFFSRFNNTSYDSISATLARHRVSPTIIQWVRDTLQGRRATATLGWGSPGV
jgi:hypothetical protein